MRQREDNVEDREGLRGVVSVYVLLIYTERVVDLVSSMSYLCSSRRQNMSVTKLVSSISHLRKTGYT